VFFLETNMLLFTLPNSNAQTLAPIETLDFYCPQSITLPAPITPQLAWTIVMSHRSPILTAAFTIRDAISACFGVKKIGGFAASTAVGVKVGDKLNFFLVEHTSDDVLSLSVRDRHLDVLTCISTDQNTLTITSSVKTHNLFGRIYMIPVAPAHKLIVWNSLRRVKNGMPSL
jgi:hypothetical protein